MTAATTPAPAYGPATGLAAAENASPAAAGQADPYATRPNPTKETILMTDQMIPADAIRAWRDKYRGCTGNNALEALDALLPAPPRPTLADMTEAERAECQWMQADIIVGHDPLLITRIERSDGTATILDRNGRYDKVPAREVTPRPDLPRLTWPADQHPNPTEEGEPRND